MSVDSDITVLDTFPVWVHTCSCCVDADSPTLGMLMACSREQRMNSRALVAMTIPDPLWKHRFQSSFVLGHNQKLLLPSWHGLKLH